MRTDQRWLSRRRQIKIFRCSDLNQYHNPGIYKSGFLDLAPSKFTLEDAILVKPILKKNDINNVILVTSDFHMARAKMIFEKIFPDTKFRYAAAISELTVDELVALEQHEEKVIVRDQLVIENDRLGDYL